MRKIMFKTKEEIKQWLNEMNIQNYHIHDDLVVDVQESVVLFQNSLHEIPVQFGIVKGDFEASHNALKSAKGSPRIVLGSYGMRGNNLTDALYFPEYVKDNVLLGANKITTFKNTPLKKVEGCLQAERNKLTSFEDFPYVKYTINVRHNEITSFKGLQDTMLGSLIVAHNKITSFQYCPRIINEDLDLSNNFITRVENTPERVNTLILLGNLLEEFIDLPIIEYNMAFHQLSHQVSLQDQKTLELIEVVWFKEDVEKMRLKLKMDKELPQNNSVRKRKI